MRDKLAVYWYTENQTRVKGRVNGGGQAGMTPLPEYAVILNIVKSSQG